MPASSNPALPPTPISLPIEKPVVLPANEPRVSVCVAMTVTEPTGPVSPISAFAPIAAVVFVVSVETEMSPLIATAPESVIA